MTMVVEATGSPPPSMLIELGDAARRSLRATEVLPRGMRQESLDAGVHDEAAVGDLVGVAAAQEPAAAKLPDLEIALGPPAVDPVVEFDQSVDHGLLGGGIILPLRHVRREEHRAVGGERNLLQVVDELLEGQLRLRRRPRRDEAVDHQHRAAPPLDLTPGKVGERLQPALEHVAKGAEIGQLVRDKRLVEERHPPQVLHHARMVLGEERHDTRRIGPRPECGGNRSGW